MKCYAILASYNMCLNNAIVYNLLIILVDINCLYSQLVFISKFERKEKNKPLLNLING